MVFSDTNEISNELDHQNLTSIPIYRQKRRKHPNEMGLPWISPTHRMRLVDQKIHRAQIVLRPGFRESPIASNKNRILCNQFRTGPKPIRIRHD
jgi:hypothetical protein